MYKKSDLYLQIHNIFSIHLLHTNMKQIELTSKLVLAIIGLTSISAVLVPSYAAVKITSADIVNETIQSVDIKNGEVKTDDLANDAVTSAKIKNGEVTSEDIAPGTIPSGGGTPDDNSVTSAKIVDGEVKSADIGDGEVTSEDVADGTLTSTDLAPGAVQITRVGGDAVLIGPGQHGSTTVACPSGTILSGGGFASSGAISDQPGIQVRDNAPLGDNPNV
jgi:hypothetical protein